jgi:Clp amino terminal domain, pathogenicity island component
MFERFTEKARRTIFFARYEASQFGCPYIETEHLLLGLLRENKALANQILPSDTSHEVIRKQIEARTTTRSKALTSADIPLSRECQRVLTYAAEEADELSHKHIGTEHLLLGLLREKDCFAAQLLNERKVFLDEAREQIGRGSAESLGRPPKSPGLPLGYNAHKLLYNTATETLILELHRRDSLLLSRLFARRKDAEAYEEIGSPADDVAYESPVTCEKHPLVLFNSLRWDKQHKESHWEGVYSFNLNTKELLARISPEKLVLSEKPHDRSWIVQLVSLSDDAQRVSAKIGVEKMVSGNGVVDYYLAYIDLRSREVHVLSRLMDVHF